MDTFTLLFGPGIVGGVLVGIWLAYVHRRARPSGEPVPRREDSILVDAINISHIPVAGAGGLGLVAMALIVALFQPAIGISMSIALVLGVLLAIALIVWRRRHERLT